ncbi:hypothetical protein BDV26DRAFT_268286 [Aspergillus bertholletiae]|uniref:Uncharacterized protein n=1 Tax=Aspergillus bertholletiae TaxID=1226010 RepID=A0A5N7B0S1_9EURO|nr:hypothetical protein BDV26DRAFT_268286 [Aspergillus bertholletiae]
MPVWMGDSPYLGLVLVAVGAWGIVPRRLEYNGKSSYMTLCNAGEGTDLDFIMCNV